MVIAFVAVSSYGYFGTQATVSPTISNPNQNLAISSTSQTGAQTIQAAPSMQHFGNRYFEPQSGILVAANTLTWTNFHLNDTMNGFVSSSIFLFPFPDSIGANVTVAIYLNGVLVASSTTPLPDHNYGIESSSVPTSTSANSVYALTGLIPTVGLGTQSSSVLNINGATVTVAVVSDRPVWLAGWTVADMSGGIGPQFGQSVGQLAGTYEAPQLGTSLPNSLPQATTTLTFEFQVSGGFVA